MAGAFCGLNGSRCRFQLDCGRSNGEYSLSFGLIRCGHEMDVAAAVARRNSPTTLSGTYISSFCDLIVYEYLMLGAADSPTTFDSGALILLTVESLKVRCFNSSSRQRKKVAPKVLDHALARILRSKLYSQAPIIHSMDSLPTRGAHSEIQLIRGFVTAKSKRWV
ncbi:hypothetical protein BDR22DRAFT_821833 [Usnea florida]